MRAPPPNRKPAKAGGEAILHPAPQSQGALATSPIAASLACDTGLLGAFPHRAAGQGRQRSWQLPAPGPASRTPPGLSAADARARFQARDDPAQAQRGALHTDAGIHALINS
jgi:hypothetical protein